MALVVVEPGMSTTVQDLGRFGGGTMGISAAGAADALSLRAGNRLVGNAEGAAALEMTLRGGTFVTDAPAVVALCGSDFEASIPSWTAVPLLAGATIAIGATRSGARCTLCVRGGIDVPVVFGSASTHQRSALGGVHGRALRKGDRLAIGAGAVTSPARLRVGHAAIVAHLLRRTLRVTDGPQRDWFTAATRDAFLAAPWVVTEEADRMGLRLRGPAVAPSRSDSLVSEGVSLGAIQVPKSGQPIVLFVDHQTTGGYPKPFNVVTADLAAVGQLRPRDVVRFERVSLAEARGALRDQERDFAAAFENLETE